jgi:TatD DNase family protein
MTLFDTHCHLDVDDFADDRDEVLATARSVGVRDILVPGIAHAGWSSLAAFCATDDHLHVALGLHPVFLEQHRPEHVDMLARAVADDPPLAIGEIGLDYQLRNLDRDRQRELLDRQLALAADVGLPVVLHCRKAHDDMLQHLRRHDLRGGFCHAFNGSLVQAERYLALGFCLGFGGMLTFDRSSHLRALAMALPIDAIVLETDAPDMTVASHRYQRNSPVYLPEVLQTLAQLRNEDDALIAEQTTANAYRVLGLS